MARTIPTEPTFRQRQILEWVRRFIEAQGMPPTVREIGAAFSVTPRAVFEILQALERKGHLKRGELGARSLVLTQPPRHACPHCAAVPVVGRIAAGGPIEAIEDREAELTVSHDLCRRGELFALRVKGDSMIEAGILDGDTVLVRKQATANNGEIVVALLENEATLKYLHREGRRVRLQPANARLKPIYVEPTKLSIQGVVIGVHRQLDRKAARMNS